MVMKENILYLIIVKDIGQSEVPLGVSSVAHVWNLSIEEAEVNLGYNARTCLKNTQNQIGI
jgi:hypothetical protein